MSVAADNNNLCRGLILINTAGKVVSTEPPSHSLLTVHVDRCIIAVLMCAPSRLRRSDRSVSRAPSQCFSCTTPRVALSPKR